MRPPEIRVREYGSAGPRILVLHGGPGAPGSMAPVARALAGSFRVLEPLQRSSGEEPLTVARHVADLHSVITARCGGDRPALVGHSWGAMLALAYAAAHSRDVSALVLVGCGTFDRVARERMQAHREQRMDAELSRRVQHLRDEIPDPDERLKAMGEICSRLDSYDLATTDLELLPCDARAHEETWSDLMRLQENGVHPAAFASIAVPSLMLHGAVDPHPGAMIRATLERYLPQLEYREWPRCGHYPWLEKSVRGDFFVVLRDWLLRHSGESASSDT